MMSGEIPQRCEQILEAAGDAIAWLGEAREQSERLSYEADGMVVEYRRLRNWARRLGGPRLARSRLGFSGCLRQASPI